MPLAYPHYGRPIACVNQKSSVSRGSFLYSYLFFASLSLHTIISSMLRLLFFIFLFIFFFWLMLLLINVHNNKQQHKEYHFA